MKKQVFPSTAVIEDPAEIQENNPDCEPVEDAPEAES